MIAKLRSWYYRNPVIRTSFRHPYRIGVAALILSLSLATAAATLATGGTDGVMGQTINRIVDVVITNFASILVGLAALVSGWVAVFAIRPKRRIHPLDKPPSKLLLSFFVSGGVIAGLWASSLPGARPTDAVAAGAAVVGLYALWLNFRKQLVDEHRFAAERAQFYSRQSAELFTQAVTGLSSGDPTRGIAAAASLIDLANAEPWRSELCANILSAFLRTKTQEVAAVDDGGTGVGAHPRGRECMTAQTTSRSAGFSDEAIVD